MQPLDSAEMLRREIAEKLALMPSRQLAEVAEYVSSIVDRDSDRLLRVMNTESSASAFREAWDNDLDAMYDRL